MRSSWLTVEMNSSFSRSSSVRRWLARRSSSRRDLERLRLLLQLAAVLDHLRGLVEDRQDLVGAEIGALDHGRDHDPGGRRADRAGEQALGEVDQIGIGLGVGGERQATHAGVSGERLLGALGADIAGEQRAQVADRGAAAPQMRPAAQPVDLDEQRGLDALEAALAADQRGSRPGRRCWRSGSTAARG